MRIDVKIEGDLEAMMASEYLAGERAVTAAMRGAGQGLKTNWRSQITGAGLGQRLANAVRAEVYPKSQPSLNAAALVYTKAQKIISAHENGSLIRSANGFWLAIPLPAAGRGARGAKITPAAWEKKTGRRLRFVYRSGRTALLVDDGTVRSGSAPAFGQRAKRGFKNKTIPLFILTPQVKLSKKLDLLRAAETAVGGVPAAIIANWRNTR